MEIVKMLRNTLSTQINQDLECRSLLAADVLERCLNEYLQITTEELKLEFVRLVKDNPDAWRVLHARYGGGAKSGLGIGYHPAKLDSCVPPLIKRKMTEKMKHSSFPHCSSAAFSKPKTDSQEATKEVQGTQLLSTERFEEILTEHVHEAVTNRKSTSPTTASSSPSQLYTIYLAGHRDSDPKNQDSALHHSPPRRPSALVSPRMLTSPPTRPLHPHHSNPLAQPSSTSAATPQAPSTNSPSYLTSYF